MKQTDSTFSFKSISFISPFFLRKFLHLALISCLVFHPFSGAVVYAELPPEPLELNGGNTPVISAEALNVESPENQAPSETSLNFLMQDGGLSQSVSSSVVLSDPVVSSGKPYEWNLNGVSTGELIYTDRTYTLEVFPEKLAGAAYLKTANDDKFMSQNAFLSFQASQDTTVYVAYDVQANTPPSWLASWQTDGELFGANVGSHILYKKNFAAGEIILGGNNASGASGVQSNYLVIVTDQEPLLPAPEPDPPSEGTYLMTDGRVVIEAEHPFQNSAGPSNAWSESSSRAGFSGDGYFAAGPDSGSKYEINQLSNSPHLEYKFYADAPGTYHVWARGYATNIYNDSFHVGLDGAALQSSNRIDGFQMNEFSWSHSTMDGPVATIEVTSAGEHVLDVWMREDGFLLDKLLMTSDVSFVPTGLGPVKSEQVGVNPEPEPELDPPTDGTYLMTDGRVVIEAEHPFQNTAGSSNTWSESSARAGFSGDGYFAAGPDSGSKYEINQLSNSPHLEYKFYADAPGTYHVWARGYATNIYNDSFHVGLDGAALQSSNRIDGFQMNEFSWTHSTMDGPVATIEVTSAGEHVLDVWMREDGFLLDKLLITSDASFVPAGLGPEESAREGADPEPEPVVLENVLVTDVFENEIRLSWQTLSASDSVVEQLSGAIWEVVAVDSLLVTDHQMSVQGLSPATEYQLRVRSTAQDGQEMISEPFVVRTPALDNFVPGEVVTSATLRSASIDWPLTGDVNHNAFSTVRYREVGTTTWQDQLGLFRIDYNENKFSGSLLGLDEGREYEVEVVIEDPDGGKATQLMTIETRPEPTLPTGGRTLHVDSSSAGGDGSIETPFRTLNGATSAAQPGDIILIHAGVYPKSFFDKAGAPNNYIVYKAAGDGEVVFNDGLEVRASHVWVEGVTVYPDLDGESIVIRSDDAHEDVVIKRTLTQDCLYCIRLKGHGTPPSKNYFIADNTVIGSVPYETETFRGEGIEVDNLGTNHVIAYNRISNIADGVSYPGANSDVYGNEIFNIADDGIEMDFAGSNLRVWGNNVYNVKNNSLSFQPQSGAPWYIFKNQIVGFEESPIKFRTTDQFLFANNTIVGWTTISGKNFNSWHHYLRGTSRNNLFISHTGGEMYDFSEPQSQTSVIDWRTDLDYNGFSWGAETSPFKFNGTNYPDLTSFQSAHGLELNSVVLSSSDYEPITYPSLGPSVPFQHILLSAGSGAIDQGVYLPGITTSFNGSAPDLGVNEYGTSTPHYGPRE